MSKLIEFSPSKKLKFLKYSLLASISVGSIIAVPFETIAGSNKSGSLISLDSKNHYEKLKEDPYLNKSKTRAKSPARKPSTKRGRKQAEAYFNMQNSKAEDEAATPIISAVRTAQESDNKTTYTVKPEEESTQTTIGSSSSINDNSAVKITKDKEEILASDFTPKTVQDPKGNFNPKHASTPKKSIKASSTPSKNPAANRKLSLESEKSPNTQSAPSSSKIRQERVNAVRLGVVTRNHAKVDQVRTESSEIEKLRQQNNQDQIIKNQQNQEAQKKLNEAKKAVRDQAKKAFETEKKLQQGKQGSENVRLEKNGLVIALETEIEKRKAVSGLLIDPKEKSHAEDKIARVEKTKEILEKNWQEESLHVLKEGIQRLSSQDKIDAEKQLSEIERKQKKRKGLQLGILRELTKTEAKNNKEIKDCDAKMEEITIEIKNQEKEISFPPEPPARNDDRNGDRKVEAGGEKISVLLTPYVKKVTSKVNPELKEDEEGYLEPIPGVQKTAETQPIGSENPTQIQVEPEYLDLSYKNLDDVQNNPQPSVKPQVSPVVTSEANLDSGFGSLNADQEAGFYPDWDKETRTRVLRNNTQNSTPEIAVTETATSTYQNPKVVVETPKHSNRRNSVKSARPLTIAHSSELDKRLKYLDLEDRIIETKDVKEAKEKEYIDVHNSNPNDPRLNNLAIETLNLSITQSQLEQAKDNLKTSFRQSKQPKPILEVPLQQPIITSSVIGNSSTSSPEPIYSTVNKKAKEKPKTLDENLKDFSELWRENYNNPALVMLGNQISKQQEELQRLEASLAPKMLGDRDKLEKLESKLEETTFYNNRNLELFSAIWREDNNDPLLTELGQQITAQDNVIVKLKEAVQDFKDKVVQNNTPPVNTVNVGAYSANDRETQVFEDKKTALQMYQMEVKAKRQELENLPNQDANQINQLKAEEAAVSYVLGNPEKIEEIYDELKNKYNSQLPAAALFEDIYQELDEINAEKEIASVVKAETLDDGADTTNEKLAENDNQEVDSKELLQLPMSISDSEWQLPGLSDESKEDSKDEEKDGSDDSGIDTDFEEEAEEQLPNNEVNESKVAETNKIVLEEIIQEAKRSVAATIPTINAQHKIAAMVRNSLHARIDSVSSGDEETVIQRGLWMRGMYGTNNQGRVDNINGYKGTNKGATIGFDVEFDNNIIGVAYSNVRSLFKFKNNKNNDKEIVNSHVVSLYGQKELPKNFVLQALVSASKNFIKNKTTYLLGNDKFKSNVKHRNHSYNAEAILNYNHLMRNNLIITPNVGLRYGKSRDGVYNETGVNVQEIALTMKENNILSGIVGTKVKIPLRDVLKFNNLGLTLHTAVEHNFNEKTQRINRIIQISDNKFTQDYIIPKQPKTAYNLGTSLSGNIKNTTISLEYNYYLNKHYHSHQGSIKLKVNL